MVMPDKLEIMLMKADGTQKKQLTSNGIAVYPSQMQNPSAAKAYLYVQVGGALLPREGYVLGIQVQVRQTLRSLVTSTCLKEPKGTVRLPLRRRTRASSSAFPGG